MMKSRKIPQRMCVGCREMKNKKELLRIVKTPEGQVVLDKTGKKSGRGAYICPQLICLEQSIKGKRLQKALEKEIPVEIFEVLRTELTNDLS